ncbi:YIP1 family protein [Levilinea saccharolytica]|uniref:Protein containing Yip1 domain n=1 Tax=Levilinea saccharolytica TaxID=229921 RepID=A0A0M8JQ16_9CHLR|nr:YIP1 family protein [Levilinea saccharolytica]KPL82227.1 hypothetical protein ADN01_08965 [Levilinea saccharolytica]GAP19457.1 protein containing Yip1 domain [Levilinea saccharolytica]
MTESEMENNGSEAEVSRRLHFEWVLPLFFRPRRTLQAVARQTIGVWWVPLLLLSLAAIAAALAGGPARLQAAQMGATLPQDFQYYSPEMQAQFTKALEMQQGPVYIYIFPALGALLGVWVQWFLLAALLHLALTLSGSRSSSTTSFNLAAWASLPFLIGSLVQAVYLLSTGQLITAPGLAGFASADGAGLSAVARPFLGVVDLYWIWHIVLLLIGAVDSSGTSRLKTVIVVLTVVLLLWVLRALPGILAARLSSMPATQPFFFY